MTKKSRDRRVLLRLIKSDNKFLKINFKPTLKSFDREKGNHIYLDEVGAYNKPLSHKDIYDSFTILDDKDSLSAKDINIGNLAQKILNKITNK